MYEATVESIGFYVFKGSVNPRTRQELSGRYTVLTTSPTSAELPAIPLFLVRTLSCSLISLPVPNPLSCFSMSVSVSHYFFFSFRFPLPIYFFSYSLSLPSNPSFFSITLLHFYLFFFLILSFSSDLYFHTSCPLFHRPLYYSFSLSLPLLHLL